MANNKCCVCMIYVYNMHSYILSFETDDGLELKSFAAVYLRTEYNFA